jgi:peptidoglycan/xylan/chitin deacetylase (PgdA/CDA1 family)
MITFDDGYRDNYDVALPLLLKHGVRATFFLATDYIDRRRLYWWDRVSLLVARSTRDVLELTYPEPVRLSLEGRASRQTAVRRLQRIIKDREGLDLPRFLDAIERASDVILGADEERRLVDATVMTWEHAQAMKRAGMDVQSHTHTHRVLQTLTPEEIDKELRTSRAILEEVLGGHVRSVSYPVGKPLAEGSPIRRAVTEAGYDLGFSNATGFNRPRRFDALDVRRVSLDVSIEDAYFRAMLAVPWFAHGSA